MKKIIIIVFTFLLLIVLFFSAKQLSKPNDIDYLNSIALNAKEYTTKQNTLYYFSNSKEKSLLFKTQFSFVPHHIVEKEIDEIKKTELMLLVIDKRIDSTNLKIKKNIANSDILFSQENKYYKVIILTR